LTGVVSTAWEIVIIRMFDRVGKGIRTAPRDALIAASVNENIRGKSYGFHRAMDHTGAVIGPLLAILTLLLIFSFTGISDSLTALRWTFLLSIIPGILAVLVILCFVKESYPKTGKSGPISLSIKSFDKNFRNYLLVVILFTLGNSSDAFMLFRIEEAISRSGAVVNIVTSFPSLHNLVMKLGGEAEQAKIVNILFLPLVWSFFHVLKAVLATPLGALSDRIGRKKVISYGWIIYALVYFSFALLVFLTPEMQVVATFVLLAVYAFYYAFTEGAEKAFVADLVTEERRGTAFGLFSFSVGLGALPASIIFGVLYSYSDKLFPGFGGTLAFGFGGVIALIAMFLLVKKVKEPTRSSLN
jgi:MFS family permease